MLGTRFEEYINFDEGLPFMYNSGITRTPEVYSREANWHENLEIQLYTAGNGTVLVDRESVKVSPGDFVAVNSDVIHHTGTSDTVTYDVLIFDTAFCVSLDVDIRCLEFERKFRNKELGVLFEKLKSAYFNKDDVCRKAKLYAIAAEILVLLRERHTLSVKVGKGGKDEFEAVKNAIKYIRENYADKIYLDDIASFAFTDKYALSRSFKKVTGQTIFQYINGYRCRKTAELISEGMSVSEAAMLCGFSNMSFFTKTFKQHMGSLPSKMRKY